MMLTNTIFHSDYYIYDIQTDSVIEMNRDSSKNGGPDAGFTQRATIDISLNEFYVFSGLMRDKNSTTESVQNSFWVYSIEKDEWMKVYHNDHVGEAYWKEMSDKEPCPRFAHQLVYDYKNKVINCLINCWLTRFNIFLVETPVKDPI